MESEAGAMDIRVEIAERVEKLSSFRQS